MIAFMRGMRIPVVMMVMPLSARTASKAARNLLSRSRIRYQVHRHFDTVFASEGVHILRTPVRAPGRTRLPNAGSAPLRRELLDRMLILNRALTFAEKTLVP
jgi:hypothetical protein